MAVGVFSERWATSSATERSISWPSPVSTGNRAPAMARATTSVSKADRSVREPAAADDDQHVEVVV